MKYQFITDLPDDYKSLANPRLASLAEVWRENYGKIQHNKDIKEFNERLARRWAIETGIIEGLYSIDRGTTELLIDAGFKGSLISHGSSNKSSEKVIALLRDQKQVIEAIFDFVKQRRSISKSYIKEIHQQFTANQKYVEVRDQFGDLKYILLERGTWKTHPNNPTRDDGSVFEYCPPEHVESEMDNLINWHENHEAKNIEPEIEAAWLHHRFTKIHPFQDGNGRVARALASLLFIKQRLFPVVVSRDERDEYIKALEEADSGDLSLLISLFSRLQQREIVRALSISSTIIDKRRPIKHILDSAKEKLQDRLRNNFPYENVYSISNILASVALDKLNATKEFIEKSLENLATVDIFQSNAENSHWFRKQVIVLAKEYGYFADTETHHDWIRLRIRTKIQTDIVISLHVVGTTFVGIMAASAFIEGKERDEQHQLAVIDGPHKLSDDIFQFTYKDDPVTIKESFLTWIENAIIIGLEHWRAQL